MINWVLGWYETIHLYLFDRETYNFLANYEYDPEDFTEVSEPPKS